MKRKIKKNVFACLQKSNDICNEFKNVVNIFPTMRKVLIKVLFILILCVGSAGVFVPSVYSDPDILLQEIRIKYGADCTYEKIKINHRFWIIVYDGDGKITDLFPFND